MLSDIATKMLDRNHKCPQFGRRREAETSTASKKHKKRIAVDIARAINERQVKRDAMKQRTVLQVVK